MQTHATTWLDVLHAEAQVREMEEAEYDDEYDDSFDDLGGNAGADGLAGLADAGAHHHGTMCCIRRGLWGSKYPHSHEGA